MACPVHVPPGTDDEGLVGAGATLHVELDLINRGWSTMHNYRPVQLVLVAEGGVALEVLELFLGALALARAAADLIEQLAGAAIDVLVLHHVLVGADLAVGAEIEREAHARAVVGERPVHRAAAVGLARLLYPKSVTGMVRFPI